MYKRAVKIVDARMGIISNNEKLITEPRYFEGQVMESLLTDIHSIEPIPFSDDLDSYFVVIDDPHVQPQVRVTEKVCTATGDFTRYEKECSDNRYSLFGNLGLFFKYLLATLERYHNIYSFHASSMFSPSRNTLLLVVGGAGAGKTVFLLKGLEDDWAIFSTEMTHFRFTEKGYEFYMGSLYDNIRLGNLIYDFPRANERLKVEIPPVRGCVGAQDRHRHGAYRRGPFLPQPPGHRRRRPDRIRAGHPDREDRYPEGEDRKNPFRQRHGETGPHAGFL